MNYDVIVVGARVAGAATAMLLARRGLRVLAVDRAGFPSDTVSSHQVQPPGIARLQRWGLLDRVRDSGEPATRRVRFDAPYAVLDGDLPGDLYSPRRTVLDSLLVDAARAAGAEVRERCTVDGLVWRDGRVAGIRCRERGGAAYTISAPLVVGADGKHSFVARAVGARCYRQRPAATFACYTYWAGVPVSTGVVYQRPGLAAAVFPTNDELTMVYLSAPLAQFPAFRADIEGNYLAALDRCGDLGAQVRAGTRAERLRTTPDQPNTFRRPCGPGWALVGDAGVVMDSLSAQGIANALLDAELLTDAIAQGLDRGGPDGGGLDAALAGHRRRRDADLVPMYRLTQRLARHRSRAVDRWFLRAIADRPADVNRFLAGFAGAVPLDEVFSARRVVALAAGFRAPARRRRERGAGRGSGAGRVGVDDLPRAERQQHIDMRSG